MRPDLHVAGRGRSANGDLHPVEWAVRTRNVDAVINEMNRKVRRRRVRRFAQIGATCVIILVGGIAWLRMYQAPATVAAAPRSAVVIAPEKRILSDGTVVNLKPGAELSVSFTSDVRHVLLQRGEAHFAVAKDKARPFLVEAGGVEVRAVGTAFSVQLGSTAVDVLVTEGRIAVNESDPAVFSAAHAPSHSPHGVVIDAGNRVVVDRNSHDISLPVTVSPSDIAQLTGWQIPRVEFTATPLAEAVTLLNRYARGPKLLLADPALARVRLSGGLRVDHLDTLLQLLKDQHGIDAVSQGPGIIELRRGR